METAIQSIHAREILDSRGNPTVEVDVVLAGTAPTGAPPCPRAPRPVCMRRWSCATAMPTATAARA
jgi:hypothetical protein